MSPCALVTRMLASTLLCTWINIPAGAAQPRSVLDHNTGATIQFSVNPWVFALEQPHLAANTRDYIALYAVEISIGGTRSHYLATFFWSTVPGRRQFAGPAPRLHLKVDDRVLQLDSKGMTPRDLGISKWPLQPPGLGALLAVYEVDQALLHQLGTAMRLRLRPLTDAALPVDVWFTEWRSARRDFQDFASQVLQP